MSHMKFDCVYFGDGFYAEYLTNLCSFLFEKKNPFSGICPTNRTVISKKLNSKFIQMSEEL
jgi:hypothetical protein